jgi:hypothetical protein
MGKTFKCATAAGHKKQQIEHKTSAVAPAAHSNVKKPIIIIIMNKQNCTHHFVHLLACCMPD